MTQASNAPVAGARAASGGPNLAVAYALWFFLGVFSAHRFYLGRPISAVLQILTWGTIFVGPLWWLIDAFLLPSMVAHKRASVLWSAGQLTPEMKALLAPPASAPLPLDGAALAGAGGNVVAGAAGLVADKLKALWDMKQSGALSETEFNAQKAKLLSA